MKPRECDYCLNKEIDENEKPCKECLNHPSVNFPFREFGPMPKCFDCKNFNTPSEDEPCRSCLGIENE